MSKKTFGKKIYEVSQSDATRVILGTGRPKPMILPHIPKYDVNGNIVLLGPPRRGMSARPETLKYFTDNPSMFEGKE